jgi:hypothetical protein
VFDRIDHGDAAAHVPLEQLEAASADALQTLALPMQRYMAAVPGPEVSTPAPLATTVDVMYTLDQERFMHGVATVHCPCAAAPKNKNASAVKMYFTFPPYGAIFAPVVLISYWSCQI